MGTWIKETEQAIYLMEGNNWISRVTKRPSSTNPNEKVLDIQGLKSWFSRPDKPRAMTVSVGTGAPEPEPAVASPSQPPNSAPDNKTTPKTGTPPSSKGIQLKITQTTYLKQSVQPSSQLPNSQKVLVESGSLFGLEYYTDVGSRHWRVELRDPPAGGGQNTSWYVYIPHVELLSDTVLTVTSDTLFKLEPKLSSQLPESSQVFVKNQTQFRLISHLPAADQHTKIELANAALGPNNQSVWYVYTPDIEIKGQRQLLQTISDTLFKARPVMSSQLSGDEKALVKNKTIFLVNSYSQPESNHIKVAVEGAFLGSQNRNTWYCFVPDITISGTELGNQPRDSNPSSGQPANPADRGFPFKLPGFSGTYYSKDPIYRTNQYKQPGNFCWGEALHFDASGKYRPPANANVVYGILRVAKVMEDIRRRFGNVPIQINSWYRDPATNRAVGGASRSRHLTGDAVDFVVPNVHPYDVYARLDGWWGNQGGLASSTVFTHIDMRGYRARWDYGF